MGRAHPNPVAEGQAALRIVFMGTPDFAVPSLEHLAEAGFVPHAVVTGPDRARGRGRRVLPTPVKKAAEGLGIPRILQPPSVTDPVFARRVRALAPDVIVVVAFRILPSAVFAAARLGAFNLHASLLPGYRGAAPIHRAVMAGERVTGVTTFFLREKVDTGSIILQRRLAVGPDETAGDLHDRLKVLGARAVIDTVRLMAAGPVATVEQDDTRATTAPKIFPEDCAVPWRESAQTVHDHCRGLSPRPGARTRHGSTLLKIHRTWLAEGGGPPGAILSAGERLRVACGSGAVDILSLQREGRRTMSASDFLRGHALAVGERLGGW